MSLFTPSSEEQKNADTLNDNKFEVGRKLLTYHMLLPFLNRINSFSNAVKSLGKGAIWVDMGAGLADAIKDGLNQNLLFRGVAISFKKPNKFTPPTEHADRFKYIDGDYIENLYTKGRLRNLIGKVDLLTDIVGPLSYSKNIFRLFQIYFRLLKPNGVFYFAIVTEKNFETVTDAFGKQRHKKISEPLKVNQFYMKDPVTGEKVAVDIVEWLRTIKGIEVEEVSDYDVEKRDMNDELTYERYRGFRIRKISDVVQLSAVLVNTHYSAQEPAVRQFEFTP